MTILICPHFIFYLEKYVNHYLIYVELDELAQNKVLSGDNFLKSSGKKSYKIFKFENNVEKIKMCKIVCFLV